MRFTPQTKRFALVPVEPGNEKDTDVALEFTKSGTLYLYFIYDGTTFLCASQSEPAETAVIAALGFPITGEDA